MKNLYITSVLLLLSVASYAQYGQFPNGGFENWSDLDLFDYPTDWTNSNTQEFQGIPTVFKSTDAQDGMYSCELVAELAGSQDTIFGYVLHGGTDQNGISYGIPYTSNFNEIQYHYKCDLVAGDTLFIIAGRFISGVLVSTYVLEAAVGTESAWTAGSVAVPNGAQDQLFIGFVLGNALANDAPSPGSWARIDNISIHNSGIQMTNVPNPSFENWTNVSVENPENWSTLNPFLVGFGVENSTKTTDANTGTYAIQMETVQPFPGGDTLPAFLSYGAIDLFGGNPFPPAPYDASPETFSGAYKYAPTGGEQAFLQLIFFEGGSQIGFDIQTIDAAASWQTFSSPLALFGTPDSIVFIAFSGNNPGSLLLLDDLSLSGGDVGLDEFSTMNVDIYPNPARSSVMIKADGNYNLSIVNLAGNVVMTENDLIGAVKLDINHLSSGAYLVNVVSELGQKSYKLIVE